MTQEYNTKTCTGEVNEVGAGRPTDLIKEEKSIVRSCEELAQLVGRVVRDYLQDGVPGKW